MFNSSNMKLLLTSAVGLLAFTAIDAGFSKANAANFFFVPVAPSENANLDLNADPIFDIETDTNGNRIVGGGQPVSFNIFADITGFTAQGADEIALTWTTSIDPTELSFVSATANTRVSLTGQANQLVQTMSYLTVADGLGLRPHDGVNDFGITLTGVDLYNGGVRVGSIAVTAFDAPSVNNLNLPGNEFNQVVEVQSVPEPLTLLGAGTAMGFGAFFKRKLKASKSSKN